jgi:arginyl-tRNA synthetase
LQYFDGIYKRFNIKFDRLYFESEVFQKGKELVLENPNVFKKSKGAVIFEGEKYGLHNRVFINSEGFATYEAKDLALAELQFREYEPDQIVHLVGPEQIEYFKVMFKALEILMPKSKGREMHLWYGWVRLKGGKMSSRTGIIVRGIELLDEVKEKLKGQELVAQAALRYALLKNRRQTNMAFDIEESVNLLGNSGPYLQYTYARIRSILRKQPFKRMALLPAVSQQEKDIMLKLSLFPELAESAAQEYEPSIIAKYLFDLAQLFNNYYQKVPILRSKEPEKLFRLALISAVAVVLKKGLDLLGIEVLEKM